VAVTWFEARPVAEGVELEAFFSSGVDAVDVRVYRADGEGDFALLDEVPAPGTGTFRYLDASVNAGGTYTYRIGVVDPDGEFLSAGYRVSTPAVAAVLEQNVPNPFNPTTLIRFSLPEPAPVKLFVYDGGGRLVKTLVDTDLGAGAHTVIWDARDRSGNPVSSGVYFYRIETASFVESRKMVLLK
jgi:hypothetical protein